MENQVSSKSIILNNGLYLGIISVISHLALYATGSLLELNWINSIVGAVAMIVLIVMGINAYKQNSNGFISWGQGVKIGMGITMISALITVVYILLFMNFIEPDFQQQALEFQRQAWVDAGLSEEQITSMLKQSFEKASEDKEIRALGEAKIEGEQIITAVQNALDKNGSQLLSDDEIKKIESAMLLLSSSLQLDDPDLIISHTKNLNTLTESFAAMLMDESVDKALKGQSIDKVNL